MEYNEEEMQRIIAEAVTAYIKDRKSVMVKLPGKDWELTDNFGYMKGVLSGGFDAYCVVFPFLIGNNDEDGILSVLYNIEGKDDICKASVKVTKKEDIDEDSASITLQISAGLYDKVEAAASLIGNVIEPPEVTRDFIDLEKEVELVPVPEIEEVIDE